MSKDIVIHCPSKTHDRLITKVRDGIKTVHKPSKKILFVADETSIGQFKTQCGDHRCRKANGNKGWFQITLNGCGGYEVSKLPLQKFKLNKVPCVVGIK